MRAPNYRHPVSAVKPRPNSEQKTTPSPVRSFDEFEGADSFFPLYLSILPFVAAEYFAQLEMQSFISGLIFPLGYLLFWAFYYTYYRPGRLESKLTGSTKEFGSLPGILIGVAIWFVKVTFIELSHFLLLRWVFRRPKKVKAEARPFTPPPRPRPQPAPAATEKVPPRPAPGRPPLPSDILIALQTLELGDCRDWKIIHHQYRMLAKKFHPDLNPEITGNTRFIRIDSAYRKLSAARIQFFK